MCWAQLFSWLAADGWVGGSEPAQGSFFAGCWQYNDAAGGNKQKFGKPLSEHSGLLLTVTCFGVGKGWGANIALGW